MSRVILLLLAIFTTLNCTFAYFTSSSKTINKINTKGYEIRIDANGGIFDSKSVVVSKNSTDLPIPKRTGYSFSGYSNSATGFALLLYSLQSLKKRLILRDKTRYQKIIKLQFY